MINEIRIAFLNNLNTLKWMDNETRNAAINKANAITDMIGQYKLIFVIESRLNLNYKIKLIKNLD